MASEHPLVGMVVDVTWTRPEGDDWRRFKVLAAGDGWLRLQGVACVSEPYAGGPIWVPDHGITCLEEVADA